MPCALSPPPSHIWRQLQYVVSAPLEKASLAPAACLRQYSVAVKSPHDHDNSVRENSLTVSGLVHHLDGMEAGAATVAEAYVLIHSRKRTTLGFCMDF